MLGYVVGRGTSNDPLTKVPFVKGYVNSLERTHFQKSICERSFMT